VLWLVLHFLQRAYSQNETPDRLSKDLVPQRATVLAVWGLCRGGWGRRWGERRKSEVLSKVTLRSRNS